MMQYLAMGEARRALAAQDGQTTQYGGYPDNGLYQLGEPKAYILLTTGQYSGTVAIALNGKTQTLSNNCVWDQRTRRMWMRNPSASVGPASDGKLAWTTNGSGEGIYTYVAAANAASLAGYSDWQVPDIDQLLRLRIIEAGAASPNSSYFSGIGTGIYWSSTTQNNSTTQALSIRWLDNQQVQQTKVTASLLLLSRSG